MRSYYKLSKILKVIKYLLILGLILYFIILSTNSIFCLFDKYICCEKELTLLSYVDFKKFILDIYIVTFIITLFVVLYLSRKQRYSLNKIFCILVSGLLFLPVSALLIYNFVTLKSLMSSFYLLVVFSILMIIINQLTNRIDRLYNIAVGSNEIKKERKENMQGKVKWFSSEKGYGFISSSEKEQDIYVHFSDIVMKGFKTLDENDIVEFDYDEEMNKAVNVHKISVSEENDETKSE